MCIHLWKSAALILLQCNNTTSMCDSYFFPLPWSCSFSNYCELCNCEHVMFQKCVCDSPNTGSGLPAKRDSEIFLASACDLDSSQKNSPRSLLSSSSSLCSFLSLSPSAPSPLCSKRDSGSTLFITHQHSLSIISPEMHSTPQLRFCQRLAPGPPRMAPERTPGPGPGLWLGPTDLPQDPLTIPGTHRPSPRPTDHPWDTPTFPRTHRPSPGPTDHPWDPLTFPRTH